MKIFQTASEMREWSLAQRCRGKSIGFVPTMGALHEGHASLMRAAAARDDVSVLSLFVNPAQFGPNEDYSRYPRTWDADLALAESIGTDAIYNPDAHDMYPDDYSTYVTVDAVSNGLCSVTRPHFFRGVATVVTKLFNAVLPHRAYFGQKDGQQCAVIKRMTRDLDMGIEIVEMPIVREPDGLAMSSRNVYLTTADRARALCLSRSLFAAEKLMRDGERNGAVLKRFVCDGMREVDIDYVELVDAETMAPADCVDRPVMLAVAAQVGAARLIDNVKFTPPECKGHAGQNGG